MPSSPPPPPEGNNNDAVKRCRERKKRLEAEAKVNEQIYDAQICEKQESLQKLIDKFNEHWARLSPEKRADPQAQFFLPNA